jgi:hypothetical protein
MVAYFIRRSRDDCAVIKLYPDDREEIVQDGLSLIEAEILCVAKIEDLPRPLASPACSGDPNLHTRTRPKPRRDTRQLALKF